MTGQPWTFAQAEERCKGASQRQQGAEEAMREAATAYAMAEERFRLALAKAIVTAHDEDGKAWSVCPDIARGDPEVARLRRERDIAEGVREATVQAAWRRSADRKDAQRFADWSCRRQMADLAGPEPEPDNPVVYGARAA